MSISPSPGRAKRGPGLRKNTDPLCPPCSLAWHPTGTWYHQFPFLPLPHRVLPRQASPRRRLRFSCSCESDSQSGPLQLAGQGAESSGADRAGPFSAHSGLCHFETCRYRQLADGRTGLQLRGVWVRDTHGCHLYRGSSGSHFHRKSGPIWTRVLWQFPLLWQPRQLCLPTVTLPPGLWPSDVHVSTLTFVPSASWPLEDHGHWKVTQKASQPQLLKCVLCSSGAVRVAESPLMWDPRVCHHCGFAYFTIA